MSSENQKVKKMKLRIIEAGYKAVEHLIEVAEEKVIQKQVNEEGDIYELAADRLKNAAATKKIAIFDAFDILSRIEAERDAINEAGTVDEKVSNKKGFAERNSK